jgi:hypothetical protein
MSPKTTPIAPMVSALSFLFEESIPSSYDVHTATEGTIWDIQYETWESWAKRSEKEREGARRSGKKRKEAERTRWDRKE